MRIELRGHIAEPATPPGPAAPGQSRDGGLAGVFDGGSGREIVDPCLGIRWRRIADRLHPERPGRLVRVSSEPAADGPLPAPLEAVAPTGAEPGAARTGTRADSPVIRPGDPVVVFQETPRLRARFQAVALDAARPGDPIRVRLPGEGGAGAGDRGAVVWVLATGAGSATWLRSDRGGKP